VLKGGKGGKGRRKRAQRRSIFMAQVEATTGAGLPLLPCCLITAGAFTVVSPA
jgi:hypothetical protein